MLQNYVAKVQQLASATQIFLSHGRKLRTGMPALELKRTSQLLLTPKVAKGALRPDRPYLTASPTAVHVELTDETQDMPLLIVLEASFARESDGLGYSPPPEGDGETFRLKMGQAPNWLKFVPVEIIAPDNLHHRFRFQAVEYRLSAADLNAILEALKADLLDYIQQSKSDRGILQKIRTELAAFMKVG